MTGFAASAQTGIRVKRQPEPTRAGGSSMDKLLCWGTLGVTAVVVLLFLMDLLIGSWPLYRASMALDIFVILAGGVIIYVCVDTLMELK
jgi:hypothetical protein